MPEFVVRAIQFRVEEANGGDAGDDAVTFNDVVEWLLVTEVSMRRMPLLEQSIPGFSAAMVRLADGGDVPAAGRRLRRA